MTARILTLPVPARPVVPQPLWERDRLFLEPDLPEQTDLEDDEDDQGP